MTTAPAADPNAAFGNAHDIIEATLQAEDADATLSSQHPHDVQTLKNYIIQTITTLDNNGMVVANICQSEAKALHACVNRLNPNTPSVSHLLVQRSQLRASLLDAILSYENTIKENKDTLQSFHNTLNDRIVVLNDLYTNRLRSISNHSQDIAYFGFQVLGVISPLSDLNNLCERTTVLSAIAGSVGCRCIHATSISFCDGSAFPEKCLIVLDFYIQVQMKQCDNEVLFGRIKRNIMHTSLSLHTLLQNNQETLKRLEIMRIDLINSSDESEERTRLASITSNVEDVTNDIATLCERFDSASKWTTKGLVEILATTEMGAYKSQEALMKKSMTEDERQSLTDAQDEVNGIRFHPIDELAV
jgi:hypothetical protein